MAHDPRDIQSKISSVMPQMLNRGGTQLDYLRGYLGREMGRYPLAMSVCRALAQLPDIAETIVDNGSCHTYELWWTDRVDQLIKTIIAEWPHNSAEIGRLAYTRDAIKGEKDIQTVTSNGKYLFRHFGNLIPGHIIERLAIPEEPLVKLLTDDDMIDAMYDSNMAHSCMSGANFSVKCRHPYHVYSSRLGWALAVRYVDGMPLARALVNDKKYVRIYGTNSDQQIRPDDPGLGYWLDQNGYQRITGWSGMLLEHITYRDALIGPYLDGIAAYAMDYQDPECGTVLLITENEREADYELQCTNGYVDPIEPEDDHEGLVMDYNGNWIDSNYAVEVDDYYVQGTFHEDYCYRDYDGEWHRQADCSYLTAGEHAWEYALTRETVLTHDGTRALLSECVHVEGLGVELDELCTLVDGNWVLTETLERQAAESEG